jgi:hypothetical protein
MTVGTMRVGTLHLIREQFIDAKKPSIFQMWIREPFFRDMFSEVYKFHLGVFLRRPKYNRILFYRTK